MACSCFEIWVVLTVLTSYSPVYRPCDCDYIGKTAGHPDAPTLYLVCGGTWSRIHVMLVGHQLICDAGRKESLYAITVCMFLRNTRNRKMYLRISCRRRVKLFAPALALLRSDIEYTLYRMQQQA